MMISRTCLMLLLAAATLLSSACSSVQATSGPARKDVSVLEPGADRYAVIAELGTPVASEVDDSGRKVDVFAFRQGTHGAVKAGKAVGYGLLAVGTFGISELVTSPAEGALNKGTVVQVKVTYDGNNAVDRVEVLRDDRWVRLDDLESD